MTISLRLERNLELKLEQAARMAGATKSAFIRSLIHDFLQKKSDDLTPWETGKDVFGRYGSGAGMLSVNRKAILKEKLHAKKSRY
jgi:RHH-type transcriptional regulator, rel operon repressor / antitoxin RelB